MENIEIIKKIVEALDEKKAEDIKVIKISELTVVSDYFIIANGTSSTHVRALAEEVEDAMSKAGVAPHSIEGRSTGWILLDYNGVIVHIFTPHDRDYYSLERLWQDGEFVDINELV